LAGENIIVMKPATNSIKNYSSNPFGDKDFNRIFDELYVPLCRYTLKFVHDSAIAEDIVQELFIYFWENHIRLGRMNSLNMYLYTAVKNRALNYLKKKYTKITVTQSDELVDAFPEELVQNPSELIECKELEAILEKALGSLPEKCRTIFSLKRFADMSNKEIAAHLNISEKTVEAQMTIALRKLTIYVNTHWQNSAIILFSFFINTGGDLG